MATHKGFDQHTTATEVAGAFSHEIKGKAVTIVGVSPNSLGESMALAFAAHSPRLMILASKTLSKIRTVASQIYSTYPSIETVPVEVDLSSQSSVRRAASIIAELTSCIDVLINNAAIVTPNQSFNDQGVELQFATTFLGPFLLTNLLLPQLLASATSAKAGRTRVVNVTSAGHRLCPIRFSDVNFKLPISELPQSEQPAPGLPPSFMPRTGETYNGFLAYGQSKTANVLLSVHLTRCLKSKGIVSYSAHPGSIWTELSRHLDEEMQKVISTTGGFWKTLDQGSATMMVAALDPALADDQGCYLSDCQVDEPAQHARDVGAAERLWRLGEELVGETFSLVARSQGCYEGTRYCEGICQKVKVNRMTEVF